MATFLFMQKYSVKIFPFLFLILLVEKSYN